MWIQDIRSPVDLMMNIRRALRKKATNEAYHIKIRWAEVITVIPLMGGDTQKTQDLGLAEGMTEMVAPPNLNIRC